MRHNAGMSVRIEFWSAVATVVPVLSLALVIEARAISSEWTRRVPVWYRAPQAVVWAVLLIGASFAEYFSFKALAGESTPSWAPGLCQNVIYWLISTLLLSVVIHLLVSGPAELWALVFTMHPVSGAKQYWQMRRSLTKSRKTEARGVALIKKMDTRISEVNEVTEKAHRVMDLAGESERADIERSLVGVDKARSELISTRDESTKLLGETVDARQRFTTSVADRTEKMRIANARMRAALTDQFLGQVAEPPSTSGGTRNEGPTNTDPNQLNTEE